MKRHCEYTTKGLSQDQVCFRTTDSRFHVYKGIFPLDNKPTVYIRVDKMRPSTKGTVSRYGKKVVNPSYYGKITVQDYVKGV